MILTTPLEETDLSKLFCTFTKPDAVDNTLSEIQNKYTILFDRIFILSSTDTDEIMITYNVDMNNLQDQALMEDTILLHRKKISNTLYTINSLNSLIYSLNDGKLDPHYQINWSDYRNCILLTRDGELTRLNTKVHQIISLN